MMDQNTLTKREMDEMEAFPGKGLGLGFSLSGVSLGPYPEIYCAFEDMRDLY